MNNKIRIRLDVPRLIVGFMQKQIIKWSIYFGCLNLLLLTLSCTPKNSTTQLKPSIPRDKIPINIPISQKTKNAYQLCKDDIYSKYLNRNSLAKKKLAGSKSTIPIHLDKKTLIETEKSSLIPSYINILTTEENTFTSIPLDINKKVLFWIHYFQGGGRSYFLKWLIRKQSLKERVVDSLNTEGLPSDLFYLAMIESGLKNSALSIKNASGTWQFMEATAKYYGLRVTNWLDERKDPYKSTIAAAKYLKDLYLQFDNWYLAIASYNAGPTYIKRASGLINSSNYWEISRSDYLPRETKNYIPKFLATILIAKNPEKYGFKIGSHPPIALPKGRINLLKPVLITDLSKILGVSPKSLKNWNPELTKGYIVAEPFNPYLLKLPKIYTEKYENINQKLTKLSLNSLANYIILKGDSLSSLTKKHNISRKTLYTLNPTLQKKPLKEGMTILIPKPS